MTKQEFIQEAALRLINALTEYTMQEVAMYAKQLADEVYGKEKEEPEIPYSDEPISNLIREIDRIDEEQKKIHNEFSRWKYTKKGHAKIAQHACERENINSIAELLAFGRYHFLGIHNVGPMVVNSIDEALENLYNIKSW